MFDEATDEATDDVFDEATDDAFGNIGDALPGFEEAADAASDFDDVTVEETDASSDFEEETPASTDDALPGFDELPVEAVDDVLPGDLDEVPADDDIGDDLPGSEDVPADDVDPAAEDEDSDESFDDLFGFRLIEPAPPVTKSVATRVSELPMRAWTDNTGNYQTVGRLEKIGDTHVRLFKQNGRYSTVSLERLSQADLEYVAQMRERLGVVSLEKVARR